MARRRQRTLDGDDWSNAICGEAGEVANVVKRMRRIETGTRTWGVRVPRPSYGGIWWFNAPVVPDRSGSSL
jgi:hypothetical protein